MDQPKKVKIIKNNKIAKIKVIELSEFSPLKIVLRSSFFGCGCRSSSYSEKKTGNEVGLSHVSSPLDNN